MRNASVPSLPGSDKPGSRRTLGHFTGCLLGGAVGDALGAPVEFYGIHRIRGKCGPAGVTDYGEAYGRAGAITDDTQMTLFTAEGLLRDQQGPPRERDAPTAIWRAYQRWLSTQYGEPVGGWLSSQEFLRHERAPGMTCLSALARRATRNRQPSGQQQ